MRLVVFVAGIFLATVLSGPAFAAELAGEKQIKLRESSGAEHVVGTVRFSPAEDGTTYEVEWKDEAFEEHFLSMRPFRCFEGSEKFWCRVPYPYEIRRKVSADDLTDLEYDTLFIWKGASEYGINMWNGVYYKLEAEGDKLVGKINLMDMEKLGVPPEAGNLRPIEEYDLEPGEPDSHWLPELVIE